MSDARPALGSRSRHGRQGAAAAALIATVLVPAHAQDAGNASSGSRQFSMSAGLSLTETLTDRADLSSTARRTELITQVSPNVSIRSNAGRVQGSLNYALNAIAYARESRANSIQHSLNTTGRAMLVENFAYVDASASISQQNVSPFGPVASGTGLRSTNQTQVSTWSVTPNVRGVLGGWANYGASASYSQTDSGSNGLGRSSSFNANANLRSATSGARVGWAVDASHQESDFSSGGRRTQTDRVVGSLFVTPSYQLRLSGRAGSEVSNLTSLQRESHSTYGAGLSWTPSPRTSLSVDGDRHYYGNSHAVQFAYRTPRTSWTFGDTRSVSTNASPFARGALPTEFDLLYLNLASRYPDPVERAVQALTQLLAQGIDPTAPARSGFLTAAASQQRSQQLGMSYLGLRTSVTFSAFQTWSRRLDPLSTAVDPLAGGATVRQRGLSASISHRLTPVSSLTANATYSRTPGIGGAGADHQSFLVAWNSQIGLRTRLSVSARHSQGSAATAYDETALIAQLSHRF